MRTGEVQGALWGAKADDLAEVQEPAWRPLYETILRRAGVGPGMRLLDIGCGAGDFLVEANKVRADIAGLDASQALAAIARRRLSHAPVHVGEMEELPFDDQSFDLVTGINSFQFAGDVVAALKEAGRVCRAGGKVLMLVWGRKQDCDLLTAIMPAVSALLPPAGSSATSVAFAEPGVIERLMREAGLTPLAAEEVSHSMTYPDAENDVAGNCRCSTLRSRSAPCGHGESKGCRHGHAGAVHPGRWIGRAEEPFSPRHEFD